MEVYLDCKNLRSVNSVCFLEAVQLMIKFYLKLCLKGSVYYESCKYKQQNIKTLSVFKS